ncbi:hypothetical protein AWENTII_005165 [Aspergillus wentii]
MRTSGIGNRYTIISIGWPTIQRIMRNGTIKRIRRDCNQDNRLWTKSENTSSISAAVPFHPHSTHHKTARTMQPQGHRSTFAVKKTQPMSPLRFPPQNAPNAPNADPPVAVSRYFVNSHKLPRFPDIRSDVFQFSLFYWNPADLLGLFFALLGPAPASANAVRFFLPLTAMYGRWCLKIMRMGENPKCIKKPFMLNCTWTQPRGDHQPIELFLGASLGGYTGGDGTAWHMEIMLRRYDLLLLFFKTRNINNTGAMWEAIVLRGMLWQLLALMDNLKLHEIGEVSDSDVNVLSIQRKIRANAQKLKDLPFHRGIKNRKSTEANVGSLLEVCNNKSEQSPLNRLKAAQTAIPLLIKEAERVATNPETRFGNCAETYPFMNILRDKLGKMAFQDHSWGLAVQTSALDGATYDDKKGSKIYNMLRPPCANCRHMLQKLGHSEKSVTANFREDSIKCDLETKEKVTNPKKGNEGSASSAAVN